MGDIFCTDDVKNLLKNKYVKILGSSNWRSTYKVLMIIAKHVTWVDLENTARLPFV